MGRPVARIAAAMTGNRSCVSKESSIGMSNDEPSLRIRLQRLRVVSSYLARPRIVVAIVVPDTDTVPGSCLSETRG